MSELPKSFPDPNVATLSYPASERRTSQARLVAAMEEVMEAMAAGQAYDRAALMTKYADVADELVECLTNLDFIQNIAPQLADEAAATAEAIMRSVS